MVVNDKPDFRSYLMRIMEENGKYVDDDNIDELIEEMPIENMIEYANRYAEMYKAGRLY